MGPTLQRYFFGQVVRMIVMFAAGIAAIAYLIDFTELSNRTGSLPQFTIATALMMSAMRVPFIIQAALPFIVLFATMTTLMLLNRKYELVVARSVGVSAWQFLFPAWAAAFVVGVFAVLVVNPLAANGFSIAESIEGEWRSRPSETLMSQERPWLRQGQDDGGSMLIGADRVANRDQPILYEAVFVEVGSDRLVARRIDASRAVLEDGQWRLVQAKISRAGGQPESLPEIILPTNLTKAIIQEAIVPPEMIPFFELRGQIEAARSYGVSANPLRMQYHTLLAMPMLLVTMTLIAATVSLRFVRFGQSGGMILAGIGAGFMLYVVTAMAQSFGSAGLIPPVVAAWLPVVVATLFGVAYLLHREDG
ncbi:LPS export ABC transporter permease LptG [Oricola sp.]|uniref:LPS export ABC transporter permease LptG n=1 Tax=Oricola sp. TaxID=1979950 RepID=UPI003BAADE9F